MAAEDNGKVFPESRASADVLSVLISECRERGVELRCGEQAQEIIREPDGFTGTGRQNLIPWLRSGHYHRRHVLPRDRLDR